MQWLWWVVLAVIVVLGLGLLAYRALRATKRGRRFLALSVRGKLRFGRTLLTDPGVPLIARGIIVVLIGYLALPFDIIPDFVPVLGQLDDLLIVAAAIALLMLLVPRDVFEAALADAELGGDREAQPVERLS